MLFDQALPDTSHALRLQRPFNSAAAILIQKQGCYRRVGAESLLVRALNKAGFTALAGSCKR